MSQGSKVTGFYSFLALLFKVELHTVSVYRVYRRATDISAVMTHLLRILSSWLHSFLTLLHNLAVLGVRGRQNVPAGHRSALLNNTGFGR